MKNKKILGALLIIFAISILSGCNVQQSTNNVTSNVKSTENLITTHESNNDYEINSSLGADIKLSGSTITSDSDGVKIKNNKVTIESSGTYNVSGTLNDGQIVVDTDDVENVTIILNTVNISSKESAPIYIKKAEKVIIVLAKNSDNSVSDANNYSDNSMDDNEPNAAIFSKADLTIYGEENSTLKVNGNYKDGIASKDGLLIKDANINVTASDDGIRGKDYLVLENSIVNVTAGDNGLRSDNEDTSAGYIDLKNSTVVVKSEGDAVTAESKILVEGGNYQLETGGGSGNSYNSEESMKGLKVTGDLIINSGSININSVDDALHANNSIVINDGTIEISSGDDGIHADTSIEINGGEIVINKSYEGIESALITINDGNIRIIARDDGINVAGGNDNSAFGRPGAGGFNQVEEGSYLYINGGYIFMDAGGDGLDSNGSAVMTGGVAIVNGPVNNGNGPLDYNGTFDISGGLLIAVGSSGMAEAPSESSTQNSILVNFDSTQNAGNLINIQDSEGNNILTFSPSKQYQSIAYSSAKIKTGETYSLYLDGSVIGEEEDGLYIDAVYTIGTLNTELNIESSVTTSGARGSMQGGGDRMDRGTPPDMGDMIPSDFQR